MEMVRFAFFMMSCLAMVMSGCALREAAETMMASRPRWAFAIITLIVALLLCFETFSIELKLSDGWKMAITALESFALSECFNIGNKSTTPR